MNKVRVLSSLRKLAAILCPEIDEAINHNSPVTVSTWLNGIDTGKAVEFVSLCALVNTFKNSNFDVTFPQLYLNSPDFFYFRNVIPQHHGAQPGHQPAFDSIPLAERFYAALCPKAIMREPNGREFLVFREGHPIHLIAWYAEKREYYLERPDIVIAEGALELELIANDQLAFDYTHPGGNVSGVLRVRNDINIPLISLKISGAKDVSVSGLVECSVGKGTDTAESQLLRYLNLFGTPHIPASVLINGNVNQCPAYDFEVSLNLSCESVEAIAELFSNNLTDLPKRILNPLKGL